MNDQEIRNIALLKAENIGVDFADADEAWDSLNLAVGHEPNFAVADRAFAEATGQMADYIEEA
jgi:hypothetical protein